MQVVDRCGLLQIHSFTSRRHLYRKTIRFPPHRYLRTKHICGIMIIIQNYVHNSTGNWSSITSRVKCQRLTWVDRAEVIGMHEEVGGKCGTTRDTKTPLDDALSTLRPGSFESKASRRLVSPPSLPKLG